MFPTLNRFLLLVTVTLTLGGCAMFDGGAMHASETKPVAAPVAKAASRGCKTCAVSG